MAKLSSARHPAAESLLARLKAETAALHAEIEKVVPLLSPGLDRGAYRAYLTRLLGYIRPLEARLLAYADAFGASGLDYPSRRKTPLVVRDLRALGAPEAELDAVPSCRALPAVGSVDEAWGCLYVVEGSTLGGQVILRTVGPRLKLSRDEGLSFLAGYGERTGASWRSFAGAIGRFDAWGCDREAVVRGARATFATQMAWIAGGDTRG